MKLEGHRRSKTNHNILFRNFDVFSQSEKSVHNFKSLIFQLALNGKLDFKQLSGGRIKKPLKALVEEQKAYLKKEGVSSFSISSKASQDFSKFTESQTAAKSQLIGGKAKKQVKEEGNAFKEELENQPFNGSGFQKSLEKKIDNLKLSKFLIKEDKDYRKKKKTTDFKRAENIWPMVELGSVCKVVGGGTPSTTNILCWNGNIPWITPKDLSGYSNMYISKGQKNITKEGLQKSSAKIVPKNTILLSTRAPIGYVAIAEGPLSTNQGFRNIILNKQCLPEYIYYILKSKTKLLNSLGSGATFKELSGGKLKQIKIPLPPLTVQKEIVALMEKCALLEDQIKEKSQKQKEFSKSSMYFITQSKSKKETAHHWEALKSNFKDALYSENGAKRFKAMAFQLCLKGKLDFKKLSGGRIKKPLQALAKEQKAYLKKEDISSFSMSSKASQGFNKFAESQTAAKSQPIGGKAKKQIKEEGNAFEEQPDSLWPMVELGDVADIGSGNSAPQNKNLFKNGSYPFCRTSDIGKVHISDDFKEIHDFLNNEGIKGLKLFKKNTILIPKSGASTFLNHRALLGRDSYVSSHLATIYANQKIIIPKLLFHLLCFIDTKNLTSEQNYPSLKLPQIKKIKIPLPPLAVQKEIVAFMKDIENMERQIQKEKNLSDQLSQSLSHYP